MIKLIIFDWDDVFTLGSKEGYVLCFHNTLVALGIRLGSDDEHRRILSAWSRPHREVLNVLLNEHPEFLDRACEMYEATFQATFVDSLTYVGGANELLARLKNKYILAIATGADPAVLKECILPKFHVPDVFAQIISAYDIEDVGKNKPHPYMLEEIMKTQNVLPEETVFVGDAKTDVQMARAAKVMPIVVLTGHLDRASAEALSVEHIIEDVTRLEDVLRMSD